MKTPEPFPSPDPFPDDELRLDRMLRESSQTYIDDAGFTGRILGALPPSRRRADYRRAILLLGATALGCGCVALAGGSDLVAFLSAMVERLAAWSMLPVPGLSAAFTVGVLACWALALAAGWWAWMRAR